MRKRIKNSLYDISEELDKVVSYFLYLARISNKPITNKKLQKLVYYAQAWSLVLNNKRLFPDKIEAWIHGPAIRELYFKFNKFGFKPIEINLNKDVENKLAKEDKELIEEVWRVYGKCDAEYLEFLTHSELPWQKAREGLDLAEPSSNEIDLDLMKEYYTKRLEEVKQKRKERERELVNQ